MSESDQVSNRQIAAAHVLLGQDQSELADNADISVPPLRRMEACGGEAAGLRNTVKAVRSALEKAGVEFIPKNGDGTGVWLRRSDSF